MNILFYMPSVGHASGGIYQYSLATLRIISQLDHTFYVFSHNPLGKDFIDLINQNDNLILIPLKETKDSSISYKIKRIFQELNRLLQKGKIGWFRFSPKFAINRVVRKYAIDCIHSPYDQLPHHIAAPMISTIHDIQEVHLPQYFSPLERIDRAINKNFLVEKSKRIICSYGHIKKDIETLFPEASGKVEVCLLDMQNLWFSNFEKEQVVDVSNLGIEGDYIIYPAATWEHKNHINLIKAFIKATSEIDKPISLICTGKQTDFYYEKIEPLIQGEASRVKFLGIVDEITLYSLYQQCAAVVVPTKYEAGSFPLMEAMIMGIPVVCSHVTSLPETIGDDQFTFDPDNIEDIQAKLIKIVSDNGFRSENIANSNKMSPHLFRTGAVEVFKRVYAV